MSEYFTMLINSYAFWNVVFLHFMGVLFGLVFIRSNRKYVPGPVLLDSIFIFAFSWAALVYYYNAATQKLFVSLLAKQM